MCPNVPSVEELGVKDWFKEEDKTPAGQKVNKHILSGKEGRRQQQEARRQERLTVNGIVFLIFAAPVYFAAAFGAPLDYFQRVIFSIFHGVGNTFGCATNSAFLCLAGGTAAELAVAAIPAYFLMRKKNHYIAGLALIMCACLSIQHAGASLQQLPAESLKALGMSARGAGDWGSAMSSLGFISAVLALVSSTVLLGKDILGKS